METIERLHFGAAFSFRERLRMKQKRLNLFLIDMKYIRDLAHVDDHVMSVSPQVGKASRPFVGIVVVCKSRAYCVPLSSPKPKHTSMKNDIDFMKIYDGEKLIGVLNFNNMVPVDELFLKPVDMKITGIDSKSTKQYKTMLAKQLTWCQQNQEAIVKRANRLYQMIVDGKANSELRKRCCDFLLLESILAKRVGK